MTVDGHAINARPEKWHTRVNSHRRLEAIGGKWPKASLDYLHVYSISLDSLRLNGARTRSPKDTPSTASTNSVSESQDDTASNTGPASMVHMLGYMYAKNDALFGSIMVSRLIKAQGVCKM